MGTNYYKIIPVKNTLKDLLIDKINKEEFFIDGCGEVCFKDIHDLELTPNKLHIGKSSAGWKFLFDCNDWKYFYKTEKSLLDWIYDDSDGSTIQNEYGETLTREEFMDIVDETYTLLRGKERLDAKSHKKEYPEFYNNKIQEIYLGKYRVSTYTDFS